MCSWGFRSVRDQKWIYTLYYFNAFTRASITTALKLYNCKWSPTADDAHASANRAASNAANLDRMAAQRDYIYIYKFMRILLRVIVANLSFPEQDSQNRHCSPTPRSPVQRNNQVKTDLAQKLEFIRDL